MASNIVAGAIMTVVQAATLFLGTPALYYGFFSAIEIATTAFIVWYAWRWRTDDTRWVGEDHWSRRRVESGSQRPARPMTERVPGGIGPTRAPGPVSGGWRPARGRKNRNVTATKTGSMTTAAAAA